MILKWETMSVCNTNGKERGCGEHVQNGLVFGTEVIIVNGDYNGLVLCAFFC